MDALPFVVFGAVMGGGLLLAVLVLMVRVTVIRGQKDAELRCPKCLMRDVRPSYQQGLVDAVFHAFSCLPYRCRACEARFYKYQDRKADVSDAA
jgi:DNA-directed RNA polymerase subunit RPC12/RpoP